MMFYKIKVCFVFVLLFLSATITAYATDTGNASWYGDAFHGKKTASGEVFNMYEDTAAHRSFDFGTLVKVTNLDNGNSVVVRINDRGPYVGNRIIDLSKSAFLKIAALDEGVIKVEIEIVDKDENVEGDTEEGDTESIEPITDTDDDDTESTPDIDLDLDLDTDEDDTNPVIDPDTDPIKIDDSDVVYRLQFGAFKYRENAIKFARLLVKKNIKVKVYKAKYKSGKILYKVISDEEFDDIKKAREKSENYKDSGYDCFVTKFDP